MNKWVLIIFFLFNSCVFINNNVSVIDPSKNSKELIERLSLENIQPDWLFLKGNIKITNKEYQARLEVNIKTRKDSVLWASIKAPLGIELFRIQISSDSIWFIDRTKRTYFKKPFNYINEKVKIDLTFIELLNLVTAAPNLKDKNYKQLQEKDMFFIVSETSRYQIDLEKNKIIYGRIISKKKNIIEFYFSDYIKKQNYSVPTSLIFLPNFGEEFSVEMKLKNIILNKPHRFLFKIPYGYIEKE